MANRNNFHELVITINKSNPLSEQVIQVGDIILDADDTDKEIYVRWPDGHTDKVKLDFGVFVEDDNKPCWKPFFYYSLHGLEPFCILLEDMIAIKVPE